MTHPQFILARTNGGKARGVPHTYARRIEENCDDPRTALAQNVALGRYCHTRIYAMGGE